MKKLFPLLLFLVILSSGCTIPILNIEIPGLPDLPGMGPTVVQYEHDILVIKSLEAVPAEIDAGQTTKIIAYIENKGDKTIAGDTEVKLYDYCSGLFDIESLVCNGKVQNTNKDTCIVKNILPSQIIPVLWTLKSHSDVKLKTICPEDGLKIYAKYQYTTNSLTTISLISQEELERTVEARELKSSDSYIVLGEGPIKPKIMVEDKQPIPVFEDASTVLSLQLFNQGSGYLGDGNIIGWDFIEVDLQDMDIRGANEEDKKKQCSFYYAMSGSGSAPPDVNNIQFIGKTTPKMLCKIDLSKFGGGTDKITKTASKHVEVTRVSYSYIIDDEVIITVNPKIVN